MKIASFLYSVACSASEITTAFPYFGTTQMDLSILWGTDQPIALKSANEAFHYNQSEAKNSLPESQATTSFFEFDAWSQSTEPSFREEERDPRRKVTSFDFAFGAPTTAPDIDIFLKNSDSDSQYSLGTTAMDNFLLNAYTTSASPLFETTEAQELPIFTTEEVRTTTKQNKSKKAEISNFGAIEGKLKSLELDLGLYGKKGSEDTLFDKKTEMKEQDAGDNKVDALGVTVIPFGGRDDDSPS